MATRLLTRPQRHTPVSRLISFRHVLPSVVAGLLGGGGVLSGCQSSSSEDTASVSRSECGTQAGIESSAGEDSQKVVYLDAGVDEVGTDQPQYLYDDQGRLVGIQHADSLKTVTFEYDRNGHRVIRGLVESVVPGPPVRERASVEVQVAEPGR